MRQLLVAGGLFLLAGFAYLYVGARADLRAEQETRTRLDRLTIAVEHLADRMDQLLQEREVMAPGELYSGWYSGTPPVLIEVKTKRNPGESVTDWEARHDADVATARAAHPPI